MCQKDVYPTVSDAHKGNRSIKNANDKGETKALPDDDKSYGKIK
jgi:hypothetical protein